jgi:hypothetical protein
MPESMKHRVFGLSAKLCICGNNLAKKLSKSMEQLFMTKKYKAQSYGKLSEAVKIEDFAN